MPIQDINTNFTPTAISPTAASTTNPGNVVDLLVSEDWGMGNDWMWLIYIEAAFVSSGGGTLQLQLQGNPSDSTFSSGNVTVYDTGALAIASLGIGRFAFKYPRGFTVRYLRLNSIIATAVMSAGTYQSWLSNDQAQDNSSFASGYTIKS